MYSRTKNILENSDICRLTEKAFGKGCIMCEGDSIRELTDGHFNSAYEITLKDGRKTILKVAPFENTEVMTYEREMMAREVKIMKEIDKKLSVKIPCVYFYDDSKEVIGSDYFFMEKLKGQPLSKIKKVITNEKSEEIRGHCGAVCKELHSLYTQSGYKWKSKFMEMIEDLFADGKRKNADIGIEYDRLYEIIVNNSRFLEDVEQVTMLHGDFCDANVMVDGETLSGIIDFERAFIGDFLMEIYFNTAAQSNMVTEFMKGYGLCNIDDSIKKRRILYNIHLYLIHTIECEYRHYEEKGQYEWAKTRLLKNVELLG